MIIFGRFNIIDNEKNNIVKMVPNNNCLAATLSSEFSNSLYKIINGEKIVEINSPSTPNMVAVKIGFAGVFAIRTGIHHKKDIPIIVDRVTKFDILFIFLFNKSYDLFPSFLKIA